MNVLELEGVRDLKDLPACRDAQREQDFVSQSELNLTAVPCGLYVNTQPLEEEVARKQECQHFLTFDGLKHTEKWASGQSD